MKRLLIVLAILIPCALFLVARQAASWRPQLMAADSIEALMLSSQEITRSSSGRWMVARDYNYNTPGLLLDAEHPSLRRKVGKGLPIFSDDERLLATVTPSLDEAGSGPVFSQVKVSVEDLQTHRKTQLQPVALPARNFGPYSTSVQDGAFSSNGKTFTTVSGSSIFRWDVANGKLIFKREGELFGADLGVRLFDEGNKIWGSTREDSYIYDSLTSQKRREVPNGGVLIAGERFYFSSSRYVNGRLWIHRLSDGKTIFHSDRMTHSIFSPDGRWMLVKDTAKAEQAEVQLIEVSTGRVVVRRQMPVFREWMFDDADHVLTLDGQNRVYRWRLR